MTSRRKKALPVLMLALVYCLTCCAAGPETIAEPNFGDTKEPGSEEALVLVRWEGDRLDKTLPSSRTYILLDGTERLVLTPGSQGRIIVPRGRHTIRAIYTNESVTVKGRPYRFTVSAKQITFEADGPVLFIGK
jgi:starvation-inducible outer membrane lipoprotein